MVVTSESDATRVGRVVAEQPRSGHSRATALWFGSADRPLFGWLHLPADQLVRGGVVLCQPLGIEAICVYYSYRLLAERLADEGLAVVRFDYDGTGDSVGEEDDPGRLAAWTGSVAAATEVLSGAGVTSIGLVGVRMGALFAAVEASRLGGVDALALWDPCLSGRAFLRQQQFLRHLGGGAEGPVDDGVEAPGLRFADDTVAELTGLDLAAIEGPLARRTLVLIPPDLSRPKALVRRLDQTEVEWAVAEGQDRLLDSTLQEPPLGTIDRVALWLAGELDGPPVRVTPPRSTEAVVGRTPSGDPIVERAVQLGGPGLFGIVTEGGRSDQASVTGATDDGRPTIVLVNEGNTHHIGQARVWVDLARTLGSSGFRVLRFDLSGNGDSDTWAGQAGHVARAPEAIDDVFAAMAAVSPSDPSNVVLIGFCSGAYQVIEQSLAHPPRGICVINPSLSFEPPEPEGTAVRPARQVTRRWVVDLLGPLLRRMARPGNAQGVDRWATALEVGTWPVALATRHPGIPQPVWSMVNRYLLQNIGVSSLERIVESDVTTLLVCGPEDLLPLSLGAESRLSALERSDRFHLVQLAELDHASWLKGQRLRLIEVITDHLWSTYLPADALTGR
jgi:alpha-beta hydrolase superfamily lysophospholipase